MKALSQFLHLLKKRRIRGRLIAFLNKANTAYLMCYKQHDARLLKKYATTDVIRDIHEQMQKNPINDENCFANCIWEIMEDDDIFYVYRKKVEYKPFKYKGGIFLSSGENYFEVWSVTTPFKITSIRRGG